MNNLKCFIRILLVSCLVILTLNIEVVEAQTEKEIYIEELNDICNIVVNENIIFDNKRNNLFCVFEDQQVALNNILNNSVLEFIRNKFDLEVLSEDNYLEYYYHTTVFYDYLENEEAISLYEKDQRKLMLFFDIFENKYHNNFIKEIYNTKTISKEVKEDLLKTMLPFDEPFVQDNISNGNRLSGFNITNGVNYAINHATNPAAIIYYYYYSSGDCTNFASQILEAGGYGQNNTGNINSGWWHTVRLENIGITPVPNYVHESSKSWRIVSNFINYFGIHSTYTSHKSFAQNLRRGSFISFDDGGDGNWNHMAFVTQVDTGYSTVLGYRDYKVAQHTRNYHLWTSNSGNDWEHKAKYAIVIY